MTRILYGAVYTPNGTPIVDLSDVTEVPDEDVSCPDFRPILGPPQPDPVGEMTDEEFEDAICAAIRAEVRKTERRYRMVPEDRYEAAIGVIDAVRRMVTATKAGGKLGAGDNPCFDWPCGYDEVEKALATYDQTVPQPVPGVGGGA